MRDINRAERLLSLFTSPDSAAGIVGDLSEERGQRGSAWFWRQVLGTCSLCVVVPCSNRLSWCFCLSSQD